MRISDWSSDVCSSDLPGVAPASGSLFAAPAGGRVACSAQLTPSFPALQPAPSFCCTTTRRAVELLLPGLRSEEHTSKLQSLMRISYAVFCLKKKHHTVYLSAVRTYHNTCYHDRTS